MALSASRKKKFITIASGAIFAMTLTYFVYHSISGRNGLIAMVQLSKQVETSKKELDEITMERLKLQHKTDLLSNKIDRDLLDETTRHFLNYANKDDIIYFRDK